MVHHIIAANSPLREGQYRSFATSLTSLRDLLAQLCLSVAELARCETYLVAASLKILAIASLTLAAAMIAAQSTAYSPDDL